MVNMDRGRKLLVRSAFVTGSTIAVLIGAQNLALLDARQFDVSNSEEGDLETTETNTIISSPLPIVDEQEIPEATITIVQSAPNITILRQAGNPNPIGNISTPIVIQPPLASMMATPEPLIIQSQVQAEVIVVQQSAPVNQAAQQSTQSSK